MSLLRHEVVHNGEDSLLHLSGILRAENHHLSLLEVQRNCGIVHNIGDVLVRSELSSIEDVVVRSILEITVKLGLSRFDKHVGHEESMVRTSADDSNPDPVLRVPASISIDHVQFTTGVEVTLGEF